MKIAIASVGEDIDSQVSDEGGRAPFYLIFDDEKLVEVWKNPMRTGGGGAGWGVVAALVEKGVEKIVAGEIGNNMQQAIDDSGVGYIKKSGMIVKDVIADLV